MKLRILCGPSFAKFEPAGDGLPSILQIPQLRIEASGQVKEISLRSKRRAFLFGDIFGAGAKDIEARLESQPLASCRDSIEGRFALVTVDENGVCDICADRHGKLDLYHTQVDGGAVFATALDLLPGGKHFSAFDPIALAHVLCVYGSRPPKRHTWFQNIRRLGIDQAARVKNGHTEFHEIPFLPEKTRPYGEAELNEYADTFIDAIQQRSSSGGNVVFLSSGWDSTAILACLVKLHGAKKVRAVIGRMVYAERSGVINEFEIKRAKAVADYFGVRLDVVDFDYRKNGPERMEQARSSMRAHQMAGITFLNHDILSEFTAKTAETDESVFAGEISDGAHNLGFSQFTTIFHPVLEFREYSDKMASYLFGPTFLGRFHDGTALEDPVYRLLRDRAAGAGTRFDELSSASPARNTLQLLSSFFLRQTRIPLASMKNARLLTDAGREKYESRMADAYLKDAANLATPETLYAWYLRLYNSFHWQGSTVASLPVNADRHGLRIRLPFWDTRLQRFLSAMPESWGRGLDLNPTKYPLKWMLKHRVDYPLHLQVGPHSYLYDVNPNFSHAAELLYGSSFAPYFKSHLKQNIGRALLAPDIFDHEYIDRVVDNYLVGTEVRGSELSDLLSLCLVSAVGCWGDGKS